MKIIDAHIHLDAYESSQREEIINSLIESDIESLITVSMNLDSCKENLKYKLQLNKIFPAFGFHPEQNIPPKEELYNLFNWIRENNNEMIAIGEVGLPYYKNQEQALDYAPYIDLLEKFIKLAKELNKPIILHAVYQDADIACELLEKYSFKKAHFHWFKGDKKTIERMIKNGYYVSITPDVLYENEIIDIVNDYPLNLLMIETDGPWPFEGPFEGAWTHPKFMHKSVEKIAEIKQLDVINVYQKLYENTKNFYGI
jgi:TatD DNase family protein